MKELESFLVFVESRDSDGAPYIGQWCTRFDPSQGRGPAATQAIDRVLGWQHLKEGWQVIKVYAAKEEDVVSYDVVRVSTPEWRRADGANDRTNDRTTNVREMG